MFGKLLPAAVAALALSAVACSPDTTPPPTPSPEAASTPITLPVSLNEVMVALINSAADPIWAATWNEPQSERDWRELERLAYQIQIGGHMLQFPGDGPLDQEWVSDPRWVEHSQQLSRDGRRAVNAVRSRDRDLMDSAGGYLVETCEACHRDFRPDLPTMGMFGELSPLPPVSL
jgi:hypothetical protein